MARLTAMVKNTHAIDGCADVDIWLQPGGFEIVTLDAFYHLLQQ
jgi:hypothetical protein